MATRARRSILHNVVLGFMRVHVLHHCAEGPVFGLDMIEELKRHGYRVGPGTLYPMLHGMEEAGLLRSKRVAVEGRTRRYYTATAAGKLQLDELRDRVKELVEEVLETPGKRRKTAAPGMLHR